MGYLDVSFEGLIYNVNKQNVKLKCTKDQQPPNLPHIYNMSNVESKGSFNE